MCAPVCGSAALERGGTKTEEPSRWSHFFARLRRANFYTLGREMCVAHFYTFMATPNFYETPTLCLHALSGLGNGAAWSRSSGSAASRRRHSALCSSAVQNAHVASATRAGAKRQRDDPIAYSTTDPAPRTHQQNKEPARGSSRGSTAAALACLQASSAVLNPRDDSPVALLRDAHKIGLIGATTVRTLALWRRAAGAALVRVGG